MVVFLLITVNLYLVIVKSLDKYCIKFKLSSNLLDVNKISYKINPVFEFAASFSFEVGCVPSPMMVFLLFEFFVTMAVFAPFFVKIYW